ncbi:FMN-binding protein [Streptomyces sp. NPDC001604]|uniref:FMN-binding protein n=1 Tax=Streptomyces sp. NPDC001604 TaxID=3364593 RepID=UPI0036B8D7A0
MRKTTAALLGTAAATTLLTALKLGMAPVGADSSSTATAAQAGSGATVGDTTPTATAPSTSSPATCPAAFTGGGAVEPAAYLAVGDDDGDHGGANEDGEDDDQGVPAPAAPSAAAPTDSAAPAPTDTATAAPTDPASPSSPCTSAPAPASPTAAAPSSSAPATGSGLKNGTFKGALAQNEYGTIQTTVTVSGGRITDVTASFPTTPARSAQINSRAIPALRQEALTAQSASIDAVSGASFTTASYKQSLQSAIDAAKA